MGQSRGQALQGASSSGQRVDARDPHSSSAPHQHAAYWTCPGGSCRDLPSQVPPGLFRATKSAFLSQDSRRELINSKTHAPRREDESPGAPKSRPGALGVPCPGAPGGRCPVSPLPGALSGSVRRSGSRGVTASRAIRNESVFRGARDRPCEVRRVELCCLIRLSLCLHHPALIAPPGLGNKPVLADVIFTTSSQLRSQDSTQGEFLPANTLRFFIQRQPGLCLWDAGQGTSHVLCSHLAGKTQNLRSRQVLTLPFAGQMAHGLKK